ncbi:LacI family DNA-binding transcriptional regulator [Actinopolymorpha sp. B17G11]|uniref:LacI family DNA-binding transcriptional regulator n=1 Tax=Actinopolymorpha sp. B17G11 TaxID=3160861 RepID=UPI0032E490F9
MSSERRPTLREVAERAGVSIGTASGVLSDKGSASRETKAAVVAAAEELGYTRRPRQSTRAAGSALTTAGILARRLHFPSPGNPFYMEVLNGAQRACADLGIALTLETVEDADDRQLPLIVARRQAQGLLILGSLDDRFIRRLLDAGTPCVTVDHTVEDLPVDCVRSEDEHGGYLATRALLDLGHTDPPPAMIVGLPELRPLADRVAGYRRALAERGLRVPPRYVQRSADLSFPAGRVAMDQLLDLPTPPTAVFASNDSTALGALEALRTRGIAVPEQCSVIGYDDMEMASHSPPPLTTVHVDIDLLGAQGIWHLVQRVAAPAMTRRVTCLGVRLVTRDSTAPPPQQRSRSAG